MENKDKKNVGNAEASQEAGGKIAKIIDKLKGGKKPPEKPEKPEKKGRGHYRQKECPYCHNHYGNLGNHIKLKHPLEELPAELTMESLTQKKKVVPDTPGSSIYYCTNCRAELRKGENPCWNCGNTLLWEGL